jgi:hypothetical protein
VSDRDGAINVGTPTVLGTGVAIDNDPPFDIDDTTTDERLDTVNVSNVDDDVNHHVNDGDDSTIPDEGTDDDQALDAAFLGRNHPYRWHPSQRYLNYINTSHHLCFIFALFSSQSSADGRLR